MSESRILQKSALGELFQKLSASGKRILAPVKRTSGGPTPGRSDRPEACPPNIEFAEVKSPDAVALDYVQTASSAKPAVFPRHEVLLRFKPAGTDGPAAKDYVVDDTPAAPPTVLFGVHPCDAASLATLKAVFTWDSPDTYFEAKLANLTVIGLACTKADEFCFCTSVGLSPGSTKGCDILLTPLDDTKALAEILTEKGAALVALAPQLFTPANGEAKQKDAKLASVPSRFAADQLAGKLPGLFPKDEIWREQSLRCLGCGACAFVCPTCSCFDIQDEKTKQGGVRVRCWDSCGYSLFTLHASGHNPRTKQSERWRQRVMHKFAYQPERLGVTGCVGCGRCSRNCPADMNLGEHVAALAAM